MEKIPNTKFILFDFDGTINDSFKYAHLTANKILESLHKPPLTDEQFEQFRDKDLQQSIRDLKIPFYKIPGILRQVQKAFHENLDKIDVVEGLGELLQRMSAAGYRMGVLTSNSEANVNNLLEREGILDLFEYIRSEKALFGKAVSMARFYKIYKLHPEDVIYVGDETRDARAAKEAGLRIISVAWGINTLRALQAVDPDYLVENIQQFEGLFDLAD
ncbi:MAG: HAD-IA family hydrolase [Candidatus Dojkabacteria bacterium]|nr:MAG: HAD-IA family hydrolase [Candidatus Dojkabacteria bacterium]